MNYLACCWVGSIALALILGCGGAGSVGAGGFGGGGAGGVPQTSFCETACTSPCLATIEASDPDILSPGEDCVPRCEADVPTDCDESGTQLVSCLEQNSCADGEECEDPFFVFGECVVFRGDP
jgi:hypothetical protein